MTRIPISLYGPDEDVNIVALHKATHTHVHQVMNYDHRTYSQMYRAFRRRHNGLKINEAFINDILRMQSGYLDRYIGLTIGPQKLHFQMMNQLTKHYDPHHGYDNEWQYLWPKYSEAFKNYHL